MKKIIFLLLLCFPLFARGQIVSGTITGSGCIQVDVTNKGVVGISVTNSATGSAWSGTIQPQVAIGGDAAQNATVTPYNSTTAQNTITANGTYQAYVTAASIFQVCGNTVTNTVVIKLQASILSARSGGSGGGGGTVSSVSSGNFSPLFTVGVATATTTPAFSFTASNAAAGTLFGNPTGAAAASVFTTTPILGASGTPGTISFGNATSGTVTLGTVTGALGAVTASLPANTGTVAETNLAQTFTALQTFAANNISIGGVTAAGATGTSLNVFNTSPVLVTPSVTQINDANAHPFLTSSATASAVDSITITNAAAANPATVTIGTSGSDSNVNLQLASKGTAVVEVGTGPAITTLGTAGGISFVGGSAPTGVASSATLYANASNFIDLLTATTDLGPAVAESAVIAANIIPTAIGTNPGIAASDLAESSNDLSNKTTNTALTVQGGLDGTATGASGTLTARGEDVTGGSTASIVGGALTLRGGNNASTGNSATGGAATLAGGDATGGTGTTDTGGDATARGGNCTSTTGSCTPGTLTAVSGGFTAAFTNGAASDHLVQAGLGTGNAAVSHVKIQSPALGLATGTAAQAQITRWVTHVKAGSTTSATGTNVFNIASATNTAWGMKVIVHVDLISSTPNVCGTTEEFSLTGTNNNGAFGTVNVVAGTTSTLCSTGTLTLAVGATAANPSVISVTPTWATITAITSVTITVTVENVSQQEIALL